MKDMKLIMETWRKFEDAAKNKETHVFLFENNEPVKTNFNVLLEQYDNKSITEDQLVKLWEDSFNYEYEQLLKEIDWEKEAELTADPDYKPPQERGGAVEKIADFFLRKQVQLIELAKKSIEATAKAVLSVLKSLDAFRQRHPLIFKVVTVMLIAVVLYAVIVFVQSPEAQAAVKMPGGKGKGGTMSDLQHKLVRGVLIDNSDRLANAPDGAGIEQSLKIVQTVKELDAAHASGKTVDISKLHSGVRSAADMIEKWTKDPEFHEQGSATRKFIMNFYEIGLKRVFRGGYATGTGWDP